MKNHQLLPLTFACMMLVMASCKMKPHPPEAMKLPGNENSAMDYSKAENEYARKWLDRFSSLRNTIQTELISREYTLPPEQTGSNDSVLTAGKPWNIVVRNGKEVHAHSGGNEKAEDRIIYTENDPEFKVSLRISSSKDFIFIKSTSDQSSEVRILPFSCKSLKPVLIQERKPGIFYKADHFGGNNLWILSNDNAPMCCLLIAPVKAPGSAHWKAAVRENDSVFIDNFTLIDLQDLILIQRKHLNTSIELTSISPDKGKAASIENVINFPEPEGLISDLSYNRADDKLVFRYSSIITPPTCYTYGIHSMHLGIRWKKQIKNYVPDDYKAELIWAVGKNNSRIPVSLIRKRALDLQDGTNPLVLFIESGKFNEQKNDFNPELLSLTDRGFYIARVHVSTAAFTEPACLDMIAEVVSALIEKKYTSPGLITIAGKESGALIAFNTALEHPAWVRVLVLEAPVFSCSSGSSEVPYIYLDACTYNPDNGFKGLSLAAALRKITKPGNTLLVNTRMEQSPDRGIKAGLITFILSSYGINK